ncbi:helix-turn-helix domain-containing protein [Enterobacter asburiae]|uniref:helix-turn-helix domain-containing protein n=1 Tax=Enterobacter asburiae TaxID=61645 RepID=UPI0020062EDA|nr:helix-turn-helix domain-containing protein [Enterobacter asburiae]MCK7228263.1 helix-turn-helix domain-containing protein [Enterobacter asburiae]
MSKFIKLETDVSSVVVQNASFSSKTTQATRSNLLMQEIERPNEIIRHLHDALLPYATPEHVSNIRRLPDRIGGEEVVWLITTGTLSVFRLYDDLTIAVAEGPLVAGLQEIFTPFRRHYFRVSQDATISSLSVSKVRGILTEKGLWEEVAEVFAYYMRLMAYRDEHLVSRTSYTVVRTKLLEYMEKKEILLQNSISIVNYIRSTTPLSRSQIYNILTALSHGGYIKMSRGKLLAIIQLPVKF